MKNFVKLFSWVGGAIGIILVVYFISSDIGNRSFISSENEVQKVYFADHISPAHKAVIEAFNKKYKGRIEVVAVDLPFTKFSTNERKELLARSLRSKSNRLDIFSVDYIWTSRFAKWCEVLDPYFAEYAQTKIISPTIQSCISDGKIVAMPLYIDIGMMYYRKDIIQRLPNADEIERTLKKSITWDEFLSLRFKLGYANRPYYIFQANDYEGLICNYFEIAKSLDSNFFAYNTINLKSPTAKKALQLMVDFVHKQKISPLKVVEFDENQSYQYMLENDAVFVRGWPNFVENFQKEYPNNPTFQYIERAPLPHFAGKKPTSVYGGWNLMVSKFSTKKEAAIEFIRFLQMKETQKMMFELGGYIPVNHDVYADTAYLAQHPDLVFYRQLVENGFHRPSLEEYTKLSDIIAHFVHLAIKGEMTPDEALQRATEMIGSKSVLIK